MKIENLIALFQIDNQKAIDYMQYVEEEDKRLFINKTKDNLIRYKNVNIVYEYFINFDKYLTKTEIIEIIKSLSDFNTLNDLKNLYPFWIFNLSSKTLDKYIDERLSLFSIEDIVEIKKTINNRFIYKL